MCLNLGLNPSMLENEDAVAENNSRELRTIHKTRAASPANKQKNLRKKTSKKLQTQIMQIRRCAMVPICPGTVSSCRVGMPTGFCQWPHCIAKKCQRHLGPCGTLRDARRGAMQMALVLLWRSPGRIKRSQRGGRLRFIIFF